MLFIVLTVDTLIAIWHYRFLAGATRKSPVLLVSTILWLCIGVYSPKGFLLDSPAKHWAQVPADQLSRALGTKALDLLIVVAISIGLTFVIPTVAHAFRVIRRRDHRLNGRSR